MWVRYLDPTRVQAQAQGTEAPATLHAEPACLASMRQKITPPRGRRGDGSGRRPPERGRRRAGDAMHARVRVEVYSCSAADDTHPRRLALRGEAPGWGLGVYSGRQPATHAYPSPAHAPRHQPQRWTPERPMLTEVGRRYAWMGHRVAPDASVACRGFDGHACDSDVEPRTHTRLPVPVNGFEKTHTEKNHGISGPHSHPSLIHVGKPAKLDRDYFALSGI